LEVFGEVPMTSTFSKILRGMMDGWMIFGGIFVVEADHNCQENGNKMFFA
jgi:hypothetical protein